MCSSNPARVTPEDLIKLDSVTRVDPEIDMQLQANLESVSPLMRQRVPQIALEAHSWEACAVKSYIERNDEAGRLDLNTITKGASGINLFIAEPCKNTGCKHWELLLHVYLSLLAQETIISGCFRNGEQRPRTNDSLGITASKALLEMRSDIMMVGLR